MWVKYKSQIKYGWVLALLTCDVPAVNGVSNVLNVVFTQVKS